MRHVLPFLGLALLLSISPHQPAEAAQTGIDDPAFFDGGCIVAFTDGGTTVTVDTFRTGSWNASVAVSGGAACLKWCEASTGTDPATCSASRTVCPGGPLKQDATYDIAVPNNRRFLSMTSADGGTATQLCVGLVSAAPLP